MTAAGLHLPAADPQLQLSVWPGLDRRVGQAFFLGTGRRFPGTGSADGSGSMPHAPRRFADLCQKAVTLTKFKSSI
jgi:hypothetical protein